MHVTTIGDLELDFSLTGFPLMEPDLKPYSALSVLTLCDIQRVQ